MAANQGKVNWFSPELMLLFGTLFFLSGIWTYHTLKKRQKLLYLGKFYKKEAIDIWEKWGSLDDETLNGLYNIAEDIISELRTALKEAEGMEDRKKKIEDVNRHLSGIDWVELLKENIPKKYLTVIPENFSVEIEYSKGLVGPCGKVIPPAYNKNHPQKVNNLGIVLYYTGSLSKKVSLRQIRANYLPLIIHELVIALQYLRFGSAFEKERLKLNKSIYERAIKEFQKTYNIDSSSQIKNLYLKALPWTLEAQAVCTGAAKAVLEYYKGRKTVMQTGFIKDTIKSAKDTAYDDMEVLSEFGIDPIEAEKVFAELSENTYRVILDGLRLRKVPSNFIRLPS